MAGAVGTSEPAALPDAGATGTSECWTGTPDAGAAVAAGALVADAAGAELPLPAMTPSVCCALGLTP